MSTNYIYPEQEFEVKLDLKIKVNFVGLASCISKEDFENLYKDMVENGKFLELLKNTVIRNLSFESFDTYPDENFDRLCFEVVEVK